MCAHTRPLFNEPDELGVRAPRERVLDRRARIFSSHARTCVDGAPQFMRISRFDIENLFVRLRSQCNRRRARRHMEYRPYAFCAD